MEFLDYFKSKWKISNTIGLRVFIALFLSILSILIVLFIVFGFNYDEIRELGVQCEAGNKDACAKLADIAQNDKSSDRREDAVKYLADKTVLADIAKNSKDIWVRTAAVRNSNFTDQEVLGEIARSDESGWARKYAADKLDEKSLAQNVYTTIVKNYKSENLRSSAASRITDQILLAEIARKDKSSWVRLAAADRLEDKPLAQTAYSEIAKNVKERRWRAFAVERLSDPVLLADFAKNDKNGGVRFTAVVNPNFIDQTLLGYIAENDKDGWVRSRAAKKITDQTLLTYIAKNDRNQWARVAAEERLKELRQK